LIELNSLLTPDERYSYSFDGNAQFLDHILINSAMNSLYSRIAFARVNADFPETLRNDPNRAERLSDHDPGVAYFNLPPNNAPTANAGADQVIACASLTSNAVTLDGSGSSDPDNDTLTYTWTGPFPEGGGTVTGVSPSITLPMGTHIILLSVDDGNGGTASDMVTIVVGLGVVGLQSPLAALTLENDPLVYPSTAFKLGRTLPLRLSLTCGSMTLGDADVAAPRIVAIARGTAPLDISTMDLDAGASNDSGVLFRFADGVWIFNLSTKGWTA